MTRDTKPPIRKTQRTSRIRRVISSAGLLPFAFRTWRTVRYWRPSNIIRDRHLRKNATLPIPPGKLLLVTGASPEVDWFLRSGIATANAFRDALASVGQPIESFRSILDFGCGCGRVLRQWQPANGQKLFGCDYNPKLVAWCQKYLDGVDVRRNSLTPPLPYDDSSFDLVYCVSVFTHLPEDLQNQWLRELHRVISPGGILLVTLSGEGDLHRTTEPEQEQFREGNLVVVDGSLAGTNMCGAYHPESYVRRVWSQYFNVVKFLPIGAKGSPNQDLYVLRRNDTH